MAQSLLAAVFLGALACSGQPEEVIRLEPQDAEMVHRIVRSSLGFDFNNPAPITIECLSKIKKPKTGTNEYYLWVSRREKDGLLVEGLVNAEIRNGATSVREEWVGKKILSELGPGIHVNYPPDVAAKISRKLAQ